MAHNASLLRSSSASTSCTRRVNSPRFKNSCTIPIRVILQEKTGTTHSAQRGKIIYTIANNGKGSTKDSPVPFYLLFPCYFHESTVLVHDEPLHNDLHNFQSNTAVNEICPQRLHGPTQGPDRLTGRIPHAIMLVTEGGLDKGEEIEVVCNAPTDFMAQKG